MRRHFLPILVVFSLVSMPAFADVEGALLAFRNLNRDGAVDVVRFENLTPKEAAQIFQDYKPEVPGIEQAGVLVTTEYPAVLEEIVGVVNRGQSLGGSKEKPKFLLTDKFLNSNYVTNFKDRIQNDRLGVTIVTITTLTECVMWFLTDSVSTGTAIAQSALAVALAVTIGFDKDMWVNMTKPGQRAIMNLFEKLGKPENFALAKKLASEFLPNAGLTVGLQILRMGVLSFDTFFQNLTSMNFWAVTTLTASILTFSGFNWAEQLAAINKDENPVAKSILRRVAELRGFLQALFASPANIINPQVHGYGGWVVLAGMGTVGAISRGISKKLVKWIEKNPLMNRTHLAIEKLESLFSFKKRKNMCELLWIS